MNGQFQCQFSPSFWCQTKTQHVENYAPQQRQMCIFVDETRKRFSRKGSNKQKSLSFCCCCSVDFVLYFGERLEKPPTCVSSSSSFSRFFFRVLVQLWCFFWVKNNVHRQTYGQMFTHTDERSKKLCFLKRSFKFFFTF